MMGSIYVVPSSVTVPSPVQVAAQANASNYVVFDQYNTWVTQNNLNTLVAPFVYGPNKINKIYTVLVAFGVPQYWVDYIRFVPSNLTINVGDSINFTLATFGAHIVAFNSSGVFNDNDISGPNGTLRANPLYFIPYGNASAYSGGFISSGVLLPAGVPSTGGSFFTVTFTKAGTFPYICSLHDDEGMVGSITVVTPPPTTGSPTTTGSHTTTTTGSPTTTGPKMTTGTNNATKNAMSFALIVLLCFLFL